MKTTGLVFTLLFSALFFLPVQLFGQNKPRSAADRLGTIELYLEIMSRQSNDTTFNKSECFLKILKRGVSGCDRYSAVYTEKDMKRLREGRGANYSGVGMSINKNKASRIVIMNVFPGSPAESAGLRPGDIIVRVDSAEVDESSSMEEVATAIKGPLGTFVNVTTVRGNKQIGPLKIKRQKTHAPSMDFDMAESDIGYVRIFSFGKQLQKELDTALDSLSALGAKGIVIDLRNNPGGYLNAVVDILDDEFAERKGMRSVTTVSRGKTQSVFKTNSPGEYAGIPLVVVVNGRSASASEIMAGVLQDWDAAEIVGDTTFGKGSVQVIRQAKLRSGTKLWIKITNAEYMVGNSIVEIDGIGVVPDHVIDDSEVELDSYYTKLGNIKIDPDNDAQLRKALEILKDKMSTANN